MARLLIVTIEEFDRGNIVRVDEKDTAGKKPPRAESEFIEGTQGSTSLCDRTRRYVHDVITGLYPVGRRVPA